MKSVYALFTVLMLAFTANAQYIYNDFDANQNNEFTGWPNVPLVVDNPDASGINTSAHAAEWERSTEQYAHVYTLLDGKIDFTTGNVFHVKVYSPIACQVLFKIEDQNNSSNSMEVSGNVTTPNQWEQLDFDFSGGTSGMYDKIVIFFDFASFDNNTFYFDDVEGPGYSGGASGDPVTLPVTFDDPNVEYGLTDFGGNVSAIVADPTDSTNNVAQTTKTEAAESWAGTTVGGTTGFPEPIPFTEDNTTMSVAVWSPAAGIPIRLKVEDSNDPTISVETEDTTTMANTWDTLYFDFSNEAPGTAPLNLANSYNKASIFFNFGTTGAQAGEQTYYWDQMDFVGGGSGPKPLLALDVQDNFENDGWGTIDNWKFQDPGLVDLTVGEDPVDPTNHVADYNRSGSFEWTNAQFILNHRMDLTERNKFDLDVYFPSSNDYTGLLTPTAAIKLQNSLLGGNAWTTQTEVKLDVTDFDQWVTLQFDFSGVADSVNYDQVVVQLGGEGHFVPGMFYFDNLVLLNPTAIAENGMKTVQVMPNPVTDRFAINSEEEIQQLTIYTLTGSQVNVNKTGRNSYDASGLTPGVYAIVAIDAKGNKLVSKLVKR